MAYIQNFDSLSETAKWFICTALARFPDWTSAPDIQICVNGVEMEDLDAFAQSIGQRIDDAIEQRAGEIVLERYGDLESAYDQSLEEIHESLKAQVEQQFGIKLEQSW